MQMADKGEKLSPCPFCGEVPTMTHGATDDFQISCRNRKCFGPSTPGYAFSSDAIAAWNRRPSTSTGESDWVLVPREPTQAMLDAFIDEAISQGVAFDEFSPPQYPAPLYRAMLASAPAPDTKQEPVAWLVHDHSELGDYLTKSREAAVNSGLPFTSLFPSPVTQKVSEATHRHVKRGTEYVLIGYGKMQAENWRALDRPLDDPNQLTGVDYREVAIYRSVDDGSLWVRPREEFEDGRFVPLQAQEKSE